MNKTIFFLLALPLIIYGNDALIDLEFMHTMLLNNHPGVYNSEDPHFITHLNQAFAESSAKINNSSCPDECCSLLTDFAKSFNDSHLRVSFNQCSTDNNPSPLKKRKPFYSISLQDNIQWISLPTFLPNDDEQKILNDIIASLATMRSHKLIIFDVHGNGGGNSFWGKTIVENLFGESYATAMIDYTEKDTYVEWRASKDNIEYLKKLHLLFTAQNNINNETVQWLTKTVNDLQQAYDQGLLLCRSNDSTPSIPSKNSGDNPVTAKIVVVTDKGCGSACLDFIDYLKAMQHDIILFGQPTGADTVYMEVHTTDLPSKKGTFSFPMKVYRNRPRGNNVPYYPDITYRDDMNDTAKLQQAILHFFL